MDSAWQTAQDYGHFYVKYVNDMWNGMSPMEYGFLLIAIAGAGYFLMKNSVKGP